MHSRRYARDNRHLELLSLIGARAVIIVPMIGAAGPIGAITLVSSESEPHSPKPTLG